MTVELKMPALSPTMEKGSLVKWLVAEGDIIRTGDLLAEIETDKATMELESIDNGTILQIVVGEGPQDVAVGTVIALLAQAGDMDAQPTREAAVPLTSSSAKPAPDVPVIAPEPILDGIKAGPLVQRIARIQGIDLSTVTGTGPNGRIVRVDLGLAQPDAGARAVGPTCAPRAEIAPPPADLPVQTTPLSSMRRTIARRLSEAKQTVPHFYLTARCNLDALLALRGALNGSLTDGTDRISVNDMLIKAMAAALIAVPDANVQFGGDTLHHFGRADIAMAVAIEGGLVTPVIRAADSLSLKAIARNSKALAQKARDGKLAPEDYSGGTASLSNLGMFGIDEMIPVINPPQAMILGVAAGVEQPWKVEGAIGLATIMSATGSFDHRAIDGATAAQFMQAFRELVENPMLLCV
ncbi:dihydrolipoamide acetyltransferase family protein [Sphingobium boeckii]|uniref:Dihydrolipoamide acetyltransferase component of pyruvate dehydrogenase complex n=1 Tax=Sphingobium boeckii TaxID=1082345 RepID=A0A7W9AHE7_9SPHN|nr:dihydrolipoamide acetyltransferase family protein [Sphingobium boeckii]MBB5685694.1 pyruvate dehydrogenase E2 component (dihydrolipoamide acetyltransferase) [Sphingobium boeckii]